MSRSPIGRSSIGPVLFGLYLLLYGSFVLLAAFSPATMDRPIAGINLAVWYGFALIAAAVVAALIYGMMAPTDPRDDAARSDATDATTTDATTTDATTPEGN